MDVREAEYIAILELLYLDFALRVRALLRKLGTPRVRLECNRCRLRPATPSREVESALYVAQVKARRIVRRGLELPFGFRLEAVVDGGDVGFEFHLTQQICAVGGEVACSIIEQQVCAEPGWLEEEWCRGFQLR
jgi:hypothetical protein